MLKKFWPARMCGPFEKFFGSFFQKGKKITLITSPHQKENLS